MKHRVMLVEDEEDVRFVITVLLQKAGYEVLCNELENFETIINSPEHPNLFLLDRHVNGQDLLVLCRQLKANSSTRDIPVIMISADPYISELYQPAGADDFIAKPFTRETLLNKIAAALRT